KEISESLGEKLPSYMIPSFFQVCKEFPRTANGKINRKALNLNTEEIEESETNVTKELSPTEEIIYKIWSEAFKTKNISVKDNFFEIGGASLLAITVITNINSAFNINLSLREFFDNPRIKDLSEKVNAMK
ncbi:MAG: phosphopantetheine-binding protein, partial [Bacteroidales bacterium]|nr:phosphopantetheine-binding protein [Bacteroidales bacterium]